MCGRGAGAGSPVRGGGVVITGGIPSPGESLPCKIGGSAGTEGTCAVPPWRAGARCGRSAGCAPRDGGCGDVAGEPDGGALWGMPARGGSAGVAARGADGLTLGNGGLTVTVGGVGCTGDLTGAGSGTGFTTGAGTGLTLGPGTDLTAGACAGFAAAGASFFASSAGAGDVAGAGGATGLSSASAAAASVNAASVNAALHLAAAARRVERPRASVVSMHPPDRAASPGRSDCLIVLPRGLRRSRAGAAIPATA